MNIDRSRPPKGGDVALWLSGLVNDALRDAREAGLSEEECFRIVLSLGRPVLQSGRRSFLAKAARAYKLVLLRARQKHLGTDIMDEVAVRLNAEPTYEEDQLVRLLWDIFEEQGARFDD